MKRLAFILPLSCVLFGTPAQAQGYPGYGNAPGMAGAPQGMGGQSGMVPGMAAPGMTGQVPGMVAGMGGQAPGMVPGLTGPTSPGTAATPTPPGVPAGMYAFTGSQAVKSSMGLVPKFDPSFFQNFMANKVQAGTVLTGILENDISSAKNKAGDIFTIRLEDGLNVNGNQLIPQQAKIVGSISSVQAARNERGGAPGSIQISLQTLVFPDGRTCPFLGFIDRNTLQDAPSMSPSDPLKTGQKYAQRTGFYAMNFFTSRFGFPVSPSRFGKDFKMTKGEVLPIRLNRNIDIAHMTPPVAAPTVTSPANGCRKPAIRPCQHRLHLLRLGCPPAKWVVCRR